MKRVPNMTDLFNEVQWLKCEATLSLQNVAINRQVDDLKPFQEGP